jgi:hypothetical protein
VKLILTFCFILLISVPSFEASAIYQIYSCSQVKTGVASSGIWTYQEICVPSGFGGVDNPQLEPFRKEFGNDIFYYNGVTLSKEKAIEKCLDSSESRNASCTKYVNYGAGGSAIFICPKLGNLYAIGLCELGALIGAVEGASYCQSKKYSDDKTCNKL